MFVVALGMFLSTLTDSTAAAVVGTIVIVTVSGILLQVPSLEGIRPIVPTKYWAEWQNLFQPGQPLASEMVKGLVSAAIYTTIFSVLAIVRFQRKDILS
jgi:ABC-2 type transport system permease protein